MMKQDQSYIVHTGDATLYFECGRVYRAQYMRDIFRRKVQQCARCTHPTELFPGLVLRDGAGDLWTPKLRVILVPVKPEEPK